ncbi:MAG: hypothetical protein BWY19_00965 [bacterium ADurb.Bin212]|nr:MAG: hypothetical protein BWY19_00965 [bacterium ADurb.Bin212]
MDDQFNQSATQDDTGQQSGQSREDKENDARAFLAIADALDEQADGIEEVVADTSDQYLREVADDVQAIDDAVQELQNVNYEADMDDAKQQINEA